LERRIINGDKGKRKNGDTHGSYGESDGGESRSGGIAAELDRRDDPKVGRAQLTIGGDEGTAGHNGNRWRNLELPIFNGEDPMDWLTKIEQYFWLRAVREEDKLEAVMIAMEGKLWVGSNGGNLGIQIILGMGSTLLSLKGFRLQAWEIF